MIPIGAFEPRDFMKEMHTSPEDAILMHKELNVKASLGIHHGTFKLSYESQFEPSERIKKLFQQKGNENVNFFAILNGETLIID
jgi:N-acyl-phosphatidylethanolamine-hydrolysing phospholipase D